MKPILFNTEMVKAILNNRKTVTRRACKEIGSYDFAWALDERPYFKDGEWSYELQTAVDDSKSYSLKAPYQTRDILYVRETWQKIDKECFYKADNDSEDWGMSWRPSIHMPKLVARIFLKVTDVRVERLQDITETQVRKEGFRDYLAENDTFYPCGYYFRQTWDSIIKKKDIDHYGWNANPWVWVIEFEKIEGSEGNG